MRKIFRNRKSLRISCLPKLNTPNMSRFVSHFCNPVAAPSNRIQENGKKEKRGIATTPCVKRVGNRSAEGCKRRIRAHYEARQSPRAVFQEPERPTPVCPPLIRTTFIKKNPSNLPPFQPLFPSPSTNRIKGNQEG